MDFFIQLTIGVSLVILLVFIFTLIKSNYVISNGNVDLAATGQIGDFFGGVIGSLLSFLSTLYLIKNINLVKANNNLIEKQSLQEQIEKFYKYLENNTLKEYKSKIKIKEDEFCTELFILSVVNYSKEEVDNKVQLEAFLQSFDGKLLKLHECLSDINSYADYVANYLRKDTIILFSEKNRLMKETMMNLSVSIYLTVHYINKESLKFKEKYGNNGHYAILQNQISKFFYYLDYFN